MLIAPLKEIVFSIVKNFHLCYNYFVLYLMLNSLTLELTSFIIMVNTGINFDGNKSALNNQFGFDFLYPKRYKEYSSD